MTEWQDESIRNSVEAKLEEVSIKETPKELYEKEIEPVLKEYRNILEDNNFNTELREPDSSGRVTSEIEINLEVENFKIPTQIIAGGAIPNQLKIHISLEENAVTAKYQFGEDEKEIATENFGDFSQSKTETIIDAFNRELVERVK